MKKIAIVTATRAEYGILRPLILRLQKEKDFVVQVVVTGAHLSERFGNTQVEIEKDEIAIFARIPIMENGNTPYEVSVTMANAIREFASYFRDERPDIVIVLGDRTEMLGICCAAMNENIPIAHLHGGELTQGAVDDCVRHAITKMSYLHFPAAEVYEKRIIQMGESPERVFNVGALGVENILHVPLLTYQGLCREVGIPYNRKYVLVTFHPVTLELGEVRHQVTELIEAMKEKSEYFYLITRANADAGGEIVNHLFECFAAQQENVKLVYSLGMRRYLSAVRYSEFLLGNSSSGIIEAPALGTPTVNIGNRQKGRLMVNTIVQCEPLKCGIISAMCEAENLERKTSTIYGDGNTSKRIVEVLKDFLYNKKIDLRKQFYDLEQL